MAAIWIFSRHAVFGDFSTPKAKRCFGIKVRHWINLSYATDFWSLPKLLTEICPFQPHFQAYFHFHDFSGGHFQTFFPRPNSRWTWSTCHDQYDDNDDNDDDDDDSISILDNYILDKTIQDQTRLDKMRLDKMRLDKMRLDKMRLDKMRQDETR